VKPKAEPWVGSHATTNPERVTQSSPLQTYPIPAAAFDVRLEPAIEHPGVSLMKAHQHLFHGLKKPLFRSAVSEKP
jgi:hypothetical protein